MSMTELLLTCHENVAHADRLLRELVTAAELWNGVPTQTARPQVAEINRRLRAACAASEALEGLAAGNPEPRRGD